MVKNNTNLKAPDNKKGLDIAMVFRGDDLSLDQKACIMQKYKTVEISVVQGAITCDIEGGPGVERVIDAFKYALDKNVNIPLSFDARFQKNDEDQWLNGEKLYVPIRQFYIDSLEHVSTSEESGAYLIRGICFTNSNYREVKGAVEGAGIVTATCHVFEMFYNVKRRDGMVFLVKEA